MRYGPARPGAAGGRAEIGSAGPGGGSAAGPARPGADPACQRGPAAASPAGPRWLRAGGGVSAAAPVGARQGPARLPPGPRRWGRDSRRQRGRGPGGPLRPPAPARGPLPGRVVAAGEAPWRGFVVVPGAGTAPPARGAGAQRLVQRPRATAVAFSKRPRGGFRLPPSPAVLPGQSWHEKGSKTELPEGLQEVAAARGLCPGRFVPFPPHEPLRISVRASGNHGVLWSWTTMP